MAPVSSKLKVILHEASKSVDTGSTAPEVSEALCPVSAAIRAYNKDMIGGSCLCLRLLMEILNMSIITIFLKAKVKKEAREHENKLETEYLKQRHNFKLAEIDHKHEEQRETDRLAQVEVRETMKEKQRDLKEARDHEMKLEIENRDHMHRLKLEEIDLQHKLKRETDHLTQEEARRTMKVEQETLLHKIQLEEFVSHRYRVPVQESQESEI